VLGNSIASLEHGWKEAGSYQIQFNTKDQTHQQLASGVYFCVLNAGEQKKSIKLILLR
jgi:hypothetical protein